MGGPGWVHTELGVEEGPPWKVGQGRGSEQAVGMCRGGGGTTGADEGSARVVDLDETEGPPGGRGREKELTEVTGGAAAGGKLHTSGFGMYGAGCCGEERPDVRGGPPHI